MEYPRAIDAGHRPPPGPTFDVNGADRMPGMESQLEVNRRVGRPMTPPPPAGGEDRRKQGGL